MMRIGDRALLVISMLLGIAACGYLFAIVWDMLSLQNLVQVLYRIANAWYYRIGISALLLLLAIVFVRLMFLRAGARNVPIKDGIPISQNGDVRISVDALRQMCEEVAKQDHRVELSECTVHSTQQALLIALKAQCKGEQNIPIIVEALQNNIQQMLKRTCGLTTAKIQVLVEKANIVPPESSASAAQHILVQPSDISVAKERESGPEEALATGEDTNHG